MIYFTQIMQEILNSETIKKTLFKKGENVLSKNITILLISNMNVYAFLNQIFQ